MRKEANASPAANGKKTATLRFATIQLITRYAPEPVRWPVMFQDWTDITFLHWRYPPDLIAKMLPAGLRPDVYGGFAWVGITPFLLKCLRPPGFPALPWISNFPEMNVRTYVVGPEGKRGIWFFSLEASRLPAVVAARAAYGLPYRWARMEVRKEEKSIAYESHRRMGRGDASIRIEPGPDAADNECEVFLTARFRLFTRIAGRLATARVEHPPWPLREARVLRLDENILRVCGLPQAEGAPLAHYSPGVRTRIGAPLFC